MREGLTLWVVVCMVSGAGAPGAWAQHRPHQQPGHEPSPMQPPPPAAGGGSAGGATTADTPMTPDPDPP